MRCGLRICCRFMPHSSGQRQGDFRNRPEMPHRVSPRLTVWLSGALGESSDSGTPASATCWAVAFCLAVMGKLGSAEAVWVNTPRHRAAAAASGANVSRRKDKRGDQQRLDIETASMDSLEIGLDGDSGARDSAKSTPGSKDSARKSRTVAMEIAPCYPGWRALRRRPRCA